MGTKGQLASTFKGAKHGPLAFYVLRCFWRLQLSQPVFFRIGRPHLQCQCPLGWRGDKLSGIHPVDGEATEVEVEPFYSGGCQNDRIVSAFRQTLDAGGNVAAECTDFQVWAQEKKLIAATDGGGADETSLFQGQPSGSALGTGVDNQKVFSGSASGDGGDTESVGLLSFEVLVAVDSEVNVVCQKCQFDFFREEAFALQFFECLNLFSVTLS